MTIALKLLSHLYQVPHNKYSNFITLIEHTLPKDKNLP